ncbi:hypothetical protein EA472_06660 [Natrarchaeobius oligotrophus]|uniref:Uncharacterized protein n=1 Tax=Natrarchaeobius chitinivorans TaxID=1679083 RepID=A0A3N6MKP7_NATCH|nr:hypothetical protein EA472_06660 [Natrarchaeobius chitinivorans]
MPTVAGANVAAFGALNAKTMYVAFGASLVCFGLLAFGTCRSPRFERWANANSLEHKLGAAMLFVLLAYLLRTGS